MDEAGNHHSQQTDIRTENQTPHVLTHRWVLDNEYTWTQRDTGILTGGSWWGLGRDSEGWEGWGGITWGEMLDMVCTYVTTLHDLHMHPRT